MYKNKIYIQNIRTIKTNKIDVSFEQLVCEYDIDSKKKKITWCGLDT